MPRTEPYRFNTDQDGRLLLVDLWGLLSADREQSLLAHCQSVQASQAWKNVLFGSAFARLWQQVEHLHRRQPRRCRIVAHLPVIVGPPTLSRAITEDGAGMTAASGYGDNVRG
jgi:hypothetical protein